MSVSPVPRLRAVTRPLGEIPELIELADPASPLLWTRGDRGLVGIGEALRLSFAGPRRFEEAAAAWRGIAEAAEIDDPVRMPGTGLVALGAFAFDDRSAAESVLVVPRLVVARHRSAAWITEVTPRDAGRGADPELPAPSPRRPWRGAELPTDADAENADPSAIAAYLAGVREADERIARGGIEKIVLSRQVSADLDADADLRVPLARLAERYLDCWTFAVDGLIGASPETLIRSTGGAVSARVLAGTRARRTDDPAADARARDELLTSGKEQHEHAFAVQSVVTALAPYVRELRSSEEPFPLRLPNVWHLATDLGASLDERSSSIELVGALHPTAAVAGTPTNDAIAAIAELEPFDRGRYAGAVGWIDAAGDGEWVIALRCAQLGEERDGVRPITATAGGGIVAGSDAERELAETVSKFRPVTEAFAP
ncbi:isochorismate synthase [Leucobacter sp. CSA1]|uniref:isochorismate synthase n=1 Tax=Leucobacter chromiisoli TaxID=2796471 RepID=A0A934UV56_9MICO|nr:isochorismate synthase [Leucobacter chromiisoli]MBK0418878.1 isochorismate synthase [Leucobacter chromiisoli]